MSRSTRVSGFVGGGLGKSVRATVVRVVVNSGTPSWGLLEVQSLSVGGVYRTLAQSDPYGEGWPPRVGDEVEVQVKTHVRLIQRPAGQGGGL